MLNTGKLAGKTIFITGASRGIGKAIALKAAKDGARIVVAAKTSEPHPKLPGTIFTASKEIESAGGEALPCVVDVRDEESVQRAVESAVKQFGGIDIVINNASAISLTGTQETTMKKYDLMHHINTRGTFLVSKLALPYLKRSNENPHILNISPPLNLNPRWFGGHVAYTMAKYGMSMCVLGMAEEFKKNNIAVNALWPKTAIITSAMEMLGGKDISKNCRTVDIMADSAYVILGRNSRQFTGNFVIDEEILKEEGLTDMERYAVDPSSELMLDFFLDFEVAKDNLVEGGSGNAIGGVAKMFALIEKNINPQIVASTNAIFKFNISDSSNKDELWFLDLKNGSGSCGKGMPSSEADCTMSMKDADFTAMFTGKLKPTTAFISGRLKMEGDMVKAISLEKLMKQMHRSYHTTSRPTVDYVKSRKFSDSTAMTYTSIPQVFDRLGEVASSDIVSKVNALYIFEIDGGEKYFVDLKNGDGSVGHGDPVDKADVTISMSTDNLLKMFNRELKPATAFMTGKLKLSGDLAKAMALEAVLKASRGEKDFHTYSRYYSSEPTKYAGAAEVFDRIKNVTNEDMVSKVQAVYVFDVEEEGKYFIDLKSGSGDTGNGDPPTKADVTINISKSNFLKLFNREITAASAFMTGKLKVSGDLSKALTLETVLKALRDK